MTDLLFTAHSDGTFTGGEEALRCAIGKGGVIGADQKQEGDGASPLGIWRMLRVFYRADRLARPDTGLPCVPLREQDGWCDAPDHPLYNRPVSLPFAASHERLWRSDHVYDLIVELSHNAGPVIAGRGSAIFFHLAHHDYRPTEGCIALAQPDFLAVLALSNPQSRLQIAV